MTFLADLHVHSPFSLATSRSSTLAGLAAWAGLKGLDLIGTGDFTHPGWIRLLEEQLRQDEPGLFKLIADPLPAPLPGLSGIPKPARFMLSAEISCIYRQDNRTRKIHCLVFVPDFPSARRFNRRLATFGKLAADGRPTLRLTARTLLEILLDAAPEGFLVPAHVWTPWFSLFGARSGFDSLEECFGDLSDQIFALETGLSSDPGMNRRISALDRLSLISNSDCHSPGKLGREANIFNGSCDFYSLRDSLKPGGLGLAGTIEFFPQEGKYFADGHRRCEFRREDSRTSPQSILCPVCGRPPTPGVRSRIEELADRPEPFFPPGAPAIHHLLALPEIISEITGRGPNTKTVRDFYIAVLNRLGPELPLLLEKPSTEIADFSNPLALAITRVRRGQVALDSGYDGRAGHLRLFTPEERRELGPPYFHWQKPHDSLS